MKAERPGNTSSQPMSLQAARAVYWLKNNHRPMGELLDEGYLDAGRLDWAGRKAYDPNIRAAAAVLLEWLRQHPAAPAEPPEAVPPVNAGISVEQARATPWPFPPYKGQPLGALVDTHRVRLKDLVYAIENAWDDRVRRAAAVMLAISLNQAVEEPPPKAGPLQVVAGGRSYAERQQIKQSVLVGLFSGVVLFASFMLMLYGLLRMITAKPDSSLVRNISTPAGIIALGIIVAGLVVVLVLVKVFLDWALKGLSRQMDAYRQGQEGETSVVEAMCHELDGNWTLLRNVVLPGRRGDIDLVLVGPAGVWALEVKTLHGEYRNVGEDWQQRRGDRWRPIKSPSRQSRNNAGWLGNFLRADGLQQWVEPAVVWADPESPLTVENPLVAVWRLDRLPEELGNLWQTRVDDATRSRVIDKLKRL